MDLRLLGLGLGPFFEVVWDSRRARAYLGLNPFYPFEDSKGYFHPFSMFR